MAGSAHWARIQLVQEATPAAVVLYAKGGVVRYACGKYFFACVSSASAFVHAYLLLTAYISCLRHVEVLHATPPLVVPCLLEAALRRTFLCLRTAARVEEAVALVV